MWESQKKALLLLTAFYCASQNRGVSQAVVKLGLPQRWRAFKQKTKWRTHRVCVGLHCSQNKADDNILD